VAVGLLGQIARTAVVAGTWTAVSNGVSKRQAGRWANADQSQPEHQPNAYMPPPPGRYQRAMFQQHTQPAPQPAEYTPQPAKYAQQAARYAPQPGPVNPMTARLAHLQQLGELKAQGILSEAEFQTQKELILNS
jgi:hypothetical protein